MNYTVNCAMALFMIAGFGFGWSVCYRWSKKYRRITIASDAPYLMQVQEIAFNKKADLWISISWYRDPEEQSLVSMKFKDGPETREIDFRAPTCEEAAKLVVERLGKL